MPSEIANKVPQAKSHSFFVKDGDNAIVLVSPSDRRVADVIPEAPTKRRGIPRWQEAIFAAVARNSVRITDVLKLPHNQVVEIGREVAI